MSYSTLYIYIYSEIINHYDYRCRSINQGCQTVQKVYSRDVKQGQDIGIKNVSNFLRLSGLKTATLLRMKGFYYMFIPSYSQVPVKSQILAPFGDKQIARLLP